MCMLFLQAYYCGPIVFKVTGPEDTLYPPPLICPVVAVPPLLK